MAKPTKPKSKTSVTLVGPSLVSIRTAPPTVSVPMPSRLDGPLFPAPGEALAREAMIVNLIESTEAAVRAIWKLADQQARLIPPPSGSDVKCYRLRATARKYGSKRRLQFFLCQVKNSTECATE